MKLRTKLTIFIIAALITFMGFNMIVSSSVVDLLRMGKIAGYEIIGNKFPSS